MLLSQIELQDQQKKSETPENGGMHQELIQPTSARPGVQIFQNSNTLPSHPVLHTSSTSSFSSFNNPLKTQDKGITPPQLEQPHEHLPLHQRSAIKVKISALPQAIDTVAVWHIFSEYGKIESIDIVPGSSMAQSNAFIIFKPPPKDMFWQHGRFVINWNHRPWEAHAKVVPWGYNSLYQITPSRTSYPGVMEICAEELEFGILYSQDSMKAFHKTQTAPELPITLRLNLRYRMLEVQFPQRLERSSGSPHDFKAGRYWHYRFIVPFNAQFRLFRTSDESNEANSVSLCLCMESPPEFSRNYESGFSHRRGETRWDSSQDTWYRVIDLCEDPNQAPEYPTSLYDMSSVYKIGRWTTYKINFNKAIMESESARQFFKALKDFNLEVEKVSNFKMITQETPSVFELLDLHPFTEDSNSLSSIKALGNYNRISLDFQVRYQLEVCISEGYLSEYRLDQQFLEKLKALDADRARGILVGVAAQKQKIFEPMTIFQDIKIRPDRLQLPSYCFYARSVIVTPSTIYVATPTLDVSNRVLRRYREHTDRFLRVRFAEERPRGKLRSTTSATMNRVYSRVKHVLMKGIVIGDRHYQFLAFGNSQLREHTAYFFCSTGYVTPGSIRTWMGDFQDKVVAKYSARLGQCFSTTRAILGAYIRLGKLEDIKTQDQKYNFTDGVGVISAFMAKLAANELGVLTADGRSPSALQFRLGGCKGVLAIWPSQFKGNMDIWVRRSQEKFRAEYQGLEIIRWSQLSSSYLNRQLITILTSLGVHDNVFIGKLDHQVSELEEAMINPVMSSRLLQRDIDPNQMSLEVAAMVNSHFQVSMEPFMLSILQLWKAYTIKFLKEKARILISEGANLLGVVDESTLLKGHFDKDQSRVRNHRDINLLPEIFVQISNMDGIKGENNPKVIEGVVLLARNPSLHPGDIRVVRAVNIPRLHHLRDVVVLPQTGDRDIASMCSGGDLDGDDYLVIWDKSLIPREWNHEPMDFTPPPPLEVDHPVTVDDITSFFVQYVKNDTLPSIALAHLGWADQSVNGAKNVKCLELAELHSIAVDYPKSGHPAVMAPHLKPKTWPHFMEKPGRSYHSETALGKLYDRVQLVDFMPDYEKPFDNRILNAYDTDEDTLFKVAVIKEDYDEGIRRIMAQHSIQWELEVWSTFVLNHDRVANNYKFHEEIGRLSSSLKDIIRKKCYEQAGGREYGKIAPFVAAMYKVTNSQVQNALEQIKERPIPRTATLPYISFPWIFSAILGDIAIGRHSANTAIMAEETIIDKKESQIKNIIDPDLKPVKKITDMPAIDDFVKIGTGTTHRGELLSLFDHSGEKEEKLDKIEDVLNFDNVENINNFEDGSPRSNSKSKATDNQSESEMDEGSHVTQNPESDTLPYKSGEERTIDVSMSLLERLAQMHST